MPRDPAHETRNFIIASLNTLWSDTFLTHFRHGGTSKNTSDAMTTFNIEYSSYRNAIEIILPSWLSCPGIIHHTNPVLNNFIFGDAMQVNGRRTIHGELGSTVASIN